MLLKSTLTSWLSSVTLPEILWYFSLCQTLPILYILFICYTGSLLQPHIQFKAGADLQCSETNHSFLPPSHGQALHAGPTIALLCLWKTGFHVTPSQGSSLFCQRWNELNTETRTAESLPIIPFRVKTTFAECNSTLHTSTSHLMSCKKMFKIAHVIDK